MWVWCVLVLSLMFADGQGQEAEVHFDLTSGDCSENSTVVGQCNKLYGWAVTRALSQGTYTLELDCMLLADTLACIETALCHCNFSSTHPQLESGYRAAMVAYHYYNNLTQCSNISLGDTIGAEVTGPFDLKEGVNCSQYNRTAGDLALSLAVAQLPVVQAVEGLCTGVEDCYFQFDRGLERALYRKHWPEFCLVSLDLLQCLENASCQCGQDTHSTVLSLVNNERRIYRNTCNTISPSAAAKKVTITCPGHDICGWEDPSYNCQAEFEAANGASQTYAEFCESWYDLANCTEELACLCGFYQEGEYYRSLAVAKHNYVNVYQCDAIYYSFPNHTGLKCGHDDRFTEEEKILTISLAEPAFVEREEGRCPGIRACYESANARSTEAHRMKDFAAICQVDSERITCIEAAYCNCGLLNDEQVSTFLYQQRLNQGNLCYSVNEFPPLTRCRGNSTCKLSNPLRMCDAEYAYDSKGNVTLLEACRAVKNYITCTEQVGCACGLLDDGKTLAAHAVYNLTTLTLKVYEDGDCPALTGTIFPEEDGINCPKAPNADARRRLVLSYANSDEVAALAGQCQAIRTCFLTNDEAKATAWVSRDYRQLCRVQSTLVHCVEEAYCNCGLNGTAKAEEYISTQARIHNNFCSSVVTHARKSCQRTSSAGILNLSLVVLLMTLLTSAATMTP